MKIRMTKFFHGVESKNQAWEEDTEHTVSDAVGQDLIDRGRATEVVDKKKRAAKAMSQATEDKGPAAKK